MIGLGSNRSSAELENFSVLPITISVFAAIILALWPIPAEIKWARPEFGVLVLFFWMRVWSFRLGLVFAWITGLVFDLLRGDVACQSALGMTMIAYLVLVYHEMINRATLVTEMLILAGLMLVYLLAGFWVSALAGDFVWRTEYLAVVVSTSLCWPFVKWLMYKIFIGGYR